MLALDLLTDAGFFQAGASFAAPDAMETAQWSHVEPQKLAARHTALLYRHGVESPRRTWMPSQAV